MFSKTNQRGKIIVPQIRSRDSHKGKSLIRQQYNPVQYGTDQKRQLDRSLGSQIEPNQSIACSHCRARMSQFVTKKPSHPCDRGVQTAQKPFLIDLIEEKVERLCRGNAKLTREIQEREEELIQKQQQIAEIQDKFTGILLSLAQEVAQGRKNKGQWHQMKRLLTHDSDTPAYLKALQYDA